MLLQGCAALMVIKKASTAQVQLINPVDSVVLNLKTALDQYHRDKINRRGNGDGY
jgi:hypothetical protein